MTSRARCPLGPGTSTHAKWWCGVVWCGVAWRVAQGQVAWCPTPEDPLPRFLALAYALNHRGGMRRGFDNGTTQGAAWYPALGTLQVGGVGRSGWAPALPGTLLWARCRWVVSAWLACLCHHGAAAALHGSRRPERRRSHWVGRGTDGRRARSSSKGQRLEPLVRLHRRAVPTPSPRPFPRLPVAAPIPAAPPRRSHRPARRRFATDTRCTPRRASRAGLGVHGAGPAHARDLRAARGQDPDGACGGAAGRGASWLLRAKQVGRWRRRAPGGARKCPLGLGRCHGVGGCCWGLGALCMWADHGVGSSQRALSWSVQCCKGVVLGCPSRHLRRDWGRLSRLLHMSRLVCSVGSSSPDTCNKNVLRARVNSGTRCCGSARWRTWAFGCGWWTPTRARRWPPG